MEAQRRRDAMRPVLKLRPILKLRSDYVWPAILIAGLAAYVVAVAIALGMYG
jgi:hypothetical protein